MGTVLGRILLVVCAALLAAPPCRAQLLRPSLTETQIVERSSLVLRELGGLRVQQIPHSLLASAEAVAIVPGMVRGAFVVGLQHGRGVVLVKDEQGQWTPPQFMTVTGGSVGWQAGLQATDLVLVFASRGSVRNLLRGQITVGVDASAAAGPVGRRVSAATDLPMQAEIYSYSRSRGLFAGVSLDGSSVQMDADATGRYYATAPAETLPPSAVELIAHLAPFTNSQVPVGPGFAPYGAVPAAVSPHAGSQLQAPSTSSLPAGTAAGRSGMPSAARGEVAPASAIGLQNGPTTGSSAAAASLSQRHAAGGNLQPADIVALRRQLAGAVAQLDPLLDAQWKGYLQLPADWVQASPLPQARAQAAFQELRQTLQRYDAVAANPQYASLAQRPEFQTVRQLLHRLATIQTQAPLTLPPPPRN